MAMTVKNNKLATVSLGELNKNIVEKGKSMTRLATGQKIVGASDGASEFSITEKMQVQLRSLGQDVENTKTGRSMLSVGAGGIEKIVEELRGMKELAINAANDTNTDADRATIQKAFDQRKQDIADIVSSTSYNGKLLLDGTYARKHHGVAQGGGVGSGSGTGGTGGTGGPVSPYGPRGATTVPVTSTGPTMQETWPDDGVIRYGGLYTIPEGYTGRVTIESLAAAGGVRLAQAGGTLSNVYINVESPASGGANLWIDNLNISNTINGGSLIQFSGGDNTLTLIGNSILSQTAPNAPAAVVDMGDGLTVQGNGSSLTIINALNSANGLSNGGACIGTDVGGTTSGNLHIIDATLELHSGYGSAIGSGGTGGRVGDITVENTTINVTGGTFAAIGSGASNSSCGNIVFSHSTITDVYEANYGLPSSYETYRQGSVDTCIGSGYSGASCGNITVSDSIVYARNKDSALVGAGDGGSICGDIRISNSDVIGYSTHGAGVGSGRDGSRAGDIYIYNSTRVQHESGDGAAIGSGLRGHVGVIHISESSKVLLDASRAFQGTGTAIPGVGHGRNGSAGDVAGLGDIEDDPLPEDPPEQPASPEPEAPVEYDFEGTPLIIHTGTKASQQMRCYIENLGIDALGLGKDDTTGEEKVSLLTQDAASFAIGRMCEANWNLEEPTYENASDDERNNPDNYLGPIDKAINYVLGEATQLGAYMSRLEQTQNTLTINQENTTRAESTIRDADMAKEMTGFAKSNILTQASQAMLAQANQTSSGVLDLLS